MKKVVGFVILFPVLLLALPLSIVVRMFDFVARTEVSQKISEKLVPFDNWFIKTFLT